MHGRDRAKPKHIRPELEKEAIAEVFDTPELLIVVAKPDRTIVSASSGWDKLGYAKNELKGVFWETIVHPDDLKVVYQKAAEVQVGPPVLVLDVRVRCADGSYKTISWTGAYSSRTGLLYGVGRDVTEQLSARLRTAQIQQKLRESEANLAKAQQIAEIGSWSWDVSANKITWSDQLYRIVGLSPQEFEATYDAYTKCIHPADLEFFKDTTTRVLQEQKAYNLEYRIVRRNGDIRVVHELGEVGVDENGSSVSLFGTVQDITQRKQGEDSLRKLTLTLANAEQKFRRDVSDILHDEVQQLLIAARLRLSSLSPNDPSDHPKAKHVVQDLLAQALTATLTLAKQLNPPILREGRLDLAFEWLADWMSTNHGLTVQVRSVQLPALTADVTEFLFTSTRELLFNVTKHSGVTHAELQLLHVSTGLEITVSDEGSGFENNGQIESTVQGGQGLIELRERLKALGGQLNINTYGGRGCQVRMFIPIETLASDKESTGSSPVPTASHRKTDSGESKKIKKDTTRILIVDDHEVVRKGLIQLLAHEPSYTIVGEAKNGKEAIRLSQTLHPHLILMDINMPVMDGIEATRKIKQEIPDIQVIGLSIYDDPKIKSEFMSAGGSAYATKSGEVEVLLKLVGHLST